MRDLRRIGPPEWRQRRVLGAAALAAALLLAGIVAAVVAAGAEDDPGSVAATVEVATVPAVVGLSAERAEAELRDAGLAAAVERRRSARPEGTVLAARPREGSRLDRGAAVLLIVSSGHAVGRGGATTTSPQTDPGATEPSATTTSPKTETTEPPATTAAEPSPTVTERPSDTVIVEPEPALSEIPGVLDVGYVDAARVVENRGYVAETYPVASRRPRGAVVRQRPPAGTPLARGRTVRLYVSVGRGGRGAVSLEDYTALPERQARELLHRAGFTVRVVDRAAPGRRLVGKVIRQEPAAGKRLPVLSQVVLFVGR